MSANLAVDIMIPLEEYPHVHYYHTLRQAVEVIKKSQLETSGGFSLPRALLVFDEEHNLLGILRRRDILRGLEPKFLRTMSLRHRKELLEIEADTDLLVLSAGKIAKAIKEQAEQPVSEVMSPVVATVNHDDQITKVIYKMINRDQALLPVLKDRKVIGVVRSVDVFNAIVDLLD